MWSRLSIVLQEVDSLNKLFTKILGSSNLKAFAEDKCDPKLKIVLESMENILEEGENADYQHFLLFPQSFQNASFSGSLKAWIVW